MAVARGCQQKGDDALSSESRAPSTITFTLIVRLWQETVARDYLWRGSVTCVQSGERAYFQTLSGLPPAVARLLGEQSPGAPETAGGEP